MITFIIPTIGRKTLLRTIKSIQAQTIDNWKAIIIFDGIKKNIDIRDSRIIFLEIEKKGKENYASDVRNIGMKYVTSEWIGFVDDDDTISENYIELLKTEINLNKDLDVVIFRMDNQNEILPPLKCKEIVRKFVGISFSIKKKIYDNNIKFIPSAHEDYYLLDKIRENNYTICISPYVTYFVKKEKYDNNIRGERSYINNMKVAFCFWGLTRSLKYTLGSIKENIFNVFDEKNIDYDIFLHTYFLDGLYNNKQSNESEIVLNFEEYKLLNPDYFKIDNQDEVKKKINFSLYETPKRRKIALPKNSHTDFILAMYSKLQIVKLINESKNKYDYIIFLRPDVKFLDKFNLRWFLLSHGKKILIPNFAHNRGYNDRFFVGNHDQSLVYGSAFNYLHEYSRSTQLKPEAFIKYVIQKKCRLNNKRTYVRFIDFRFKRIRANGEVAKQDINL